MTENSMLVSLITVSFNSENTIKDTIESVLAQKYHNIEYLIIDGNSSDKTLEIAHSYFKRFSDKGIKFKVISENDKGMYDAMNKGIKLSNGQFIGIINSDDWYEEHTVSIVVKNFIKTNSDIIFGNLNIIGKNIKIVKKAKISKFLSSRYWNHPTTFVRKNVYEDIGIFKLDNLYSDWDFYLRARKHLKKFSVLNVTLANFRLGGISRQRKIKDYFRKIKYRYQCYIQNGYSRIYIIECIFMESVKVLF